MQLAPWSAYSTTPGAADGVRDAEATVTRADEHATLATAIDLGDADAPKTDIHFRTKQALGARLAAGALLHLFGVGAVTDSEGPFYASATAGGGSPGSLSATVSFGPPFDTPGALTLANVSSWPGVLPASECPGPASSFDCAGFAIQEAGSGAWYPATAALSPDGSALVLEVTSQPPPPLGAVANATSYGQAVWPLASLFAAPALGGLPAYPWRPAVVTPGASGSCRGCASGTT